MKFTLVSALLLIEACSAMPVEKRSQPLGGPPVAYSDSDSMTLDLANFLENLEFNLYTSACDGLTDADFDNAGFPKNYRTDIVCLTAQQEGIHIETIKEALARAGKPPVEPCQYDFPYKGPVEFVNLANMVTSVGIGAYIGGGANLIDNIPLLTAASSILPNEARHSAALRYGQPARLSPFPTAFDTALAGVWAYNLALPLVKSCPKYLPIPVLPTLTLTNPNPMPPMPPPKTPPSSFTFKWDPKKVKNGGCYFAWINQVTNVTFTPITSCGEGCGTSPLPQGVYGVAFVVITDTNDAELTELQLATYHTIAGPAEVILA